MIKNVNSSTVDMQCSNVFYCQNGANCTQVSMCRKNDTCSLMEKCDQVSKKCVKKEVCGQGSAAFYQNVSGLNTSSVSQAGTVGAKKKADMDIARARLAQLREHLDVTAMFLG
jgi:hypothetical protein